MKKILKYLLLVFVLLNLLVVLSGRSWMYKAVGITYLKGYDSSYIDDFVHFPANKILTGEHQEWAIAQNYNKTNLPKYLIPVNDSLETVALLIVKNDSIRFEKYWHGYSKDTMSNSFSMAKSFVGALIGVAYKEGIIKSLDQKVCDFIPEFCDGNKEKISIRNLLTMSSGLDWDEDYHDPFGQTATAYYGSDLEDLVVNLNSISTPGKEFNYHSSCTQLLGIILEKVSKMSINEYASERLWRPMGANHTALWSIDKKGGDEKMFCCINSNARDFARLGKLYLQKGNWNGVQLIDSTYIEESISAVELKTPVGKNIAYGYHFWITERAGQKIFYARGLWGQYIICVPEKKILVVRLGKNYGKMLSDMHREDLYSYIDAALEMYP